MEEKKNEQRSTEKKVRDVQKMEHTEEADELHLLRNERSRLHRDLKNVKRENERLKSNLKPFYALYDHVKAIIDDPSNSHLMRSLDQAVVECEEKLMSVKSEG